VPLTAPERMRSTRAIFMPLTLELIKIYMVWQFVSAFLFQLHRAQHKRMASDPCTHSHGATGAAASFKPHWAVMPSHRLSLHLGHYDTA
jgi:hypothetical protein